MNLGDLLKEADIDAECVLVMRHRPKEPGLKKVLPWLAEEKPEVFNAYQQIQDKKVGGRMAKLSGKGYVASFIGHESDKAIFVGLYYIAETKSLTLQEYQQISAHEYLESQGTGGWVEGDYWFNLELTDFYESWKGKLIVGWPPPAISWCRKAHTNIFPIIAIREESNFSEGMPEWNEIDFTWEELSILPARWRTVLSQWRAIYYIFDTSDGKGYVGSAYGKDNLLGRWQEYATSGDGNNALLLEREPKDFRFSILQRVSPDMDAKDVIRLERTWMNRLHTIDPYGLNAI